MKTSRRIIIILLLMVLCAPAILPASRKGKRALRIKDYKRALKLFMRDIDKHPDDWEAFSLVGYIYYSRPEPDYPLAQEYLTQAYALKQDDVQTNLYLLLACVANENWQKAKELVPFFTAAIVADMEKPFLFHYAQSAVRFHQGKHQEAIAGLKQAIEQEPAFGLPRRLLGRIYYDLEDYAHADLELSRALAFFPDDRDMHLLLARLFTQDSYFKPKSARFHIEKLLSDSPEDPELLMLKGRLLLKDGRAKEAIAVYEKALQREENCEILLALATLYLDKGTRNLSKSEACLTKARDICRQREDIHLLFAEFYQQAGKPRLAVQEYTLHLAARPKDIEAMTRLAYLYLKKPLYNTAKAIAYARQALAQQSDYFPALKTLGKALYVDGKYQQAEDVLQQASARNPQDGELLGMLAEMALAGKRYKQAIAYGKQAVALQPGHFTALRAMGQAAYRLGRAADALRYLKQADAIRKNDYQTCLTLAYLYQEKGVTDYRQSARYAQIALKKKQVDPDTWKLYGYALYKDGLLTRALKAYKTALSYNPHDAWLNQEVNKLKARLGEK